MSDAVYEVIVDVLRQLPVARGDAEDAADALLDALRDGLWVLQPHEPGTHRYLSTSCYHARHERCAAPVRPEDGAAKLPAQCKFCTARCVCTCHTQPGQEAVR